MFRNDDPSYWRQRALEIEYAATLVAESDVAAIMREFARDLEGQARRIETDQVAHGAASVDEPGGDQRTPDALHPEYCRREARRMRAKMASEKDEVLRREYENVAYHFELVADEIEHLLRLIGAMRS